MRARQILGFGALVLIVGAITVARPGPDELRAAIGVAKPSTDYADVHRIFRVQECMGVIPSGIDDVAAYAEWLRLESTRLGIDIGTLQALAVKLAETRNPGVMRRCAKEYS